MCGPSLCINWRDFPPEWVKSAIFCGRHRLRTILLALFYTGCTLQDEEPLVDTSNFLGIDLLYKSMAIVLLLSPLASFTGSTHKRWGGPVTFFTANLDPVDNLCGIISGPPSFSVTAWNEAFPFLTSLPSLQLWLMMYVQPHLISHHKSSSLRHGLWLDWSHKDLTPVLWPSHHLKVQWRIGPGSILYTQRMNKTLMH